MLIPKASRLERFTVAVCIVYICAGILLIEVKENEEALEVFSHLSRLFPENESFIKQIDNLKRHLEKERQRLAAQGSDSNPSASQPEESSTIPS